VRVLIVTHYFPPETGAPQARLSALAAAWAADGDAVSVLTGMPNHPTGVVPPAYRRAVFRRERADGYRVIRTWLYATPNEGVARKTLGHLSFMASSVLLGGLAAGRADVVLVSSPTFFSILSGWLLARMKRARFVVEVRDLWPAIFVELGVLTNRRVIALLTRLELAAYAVADQVVVVSEGFRADLISRGVPPAKVHTIRNGVDAARFAVATGAGRDWRARLGAGTGDCLVLYAGTHGISQALPAIADAAALVAAPLRDVPLFGTFIPSKMFEYLAAGKAVIGSVRGEAAQILAEAGAGVVRPEESGSLAAALSALSADPELQTLMGKTGRAFVERNYDRAVLARRYRAILAVRTPRRSR
jgi:glycosyltransferase involved in cell wall biosynthesis